MKDYSLRLKRTNMQVQQLLDQAAACTSEDDAAALLSNLVTAFSATGPLSHLGVYNTEAYMEERPSKEPAAFVRFELNRIISEDYITMIRPEIRDGQLVVVVITNRMLDGLGMASKSWEVPDFLDEAVIEADTDSTTDDLAQRAKELAIADHRLLIERVGVPESIARETALQSW
jgi:hypothetical protein